ncbi:SIS domain-containing protein [Sporolactobacillus shoreicorticis]|uniref:SIS domain-containing protein n=1 Tax=Sporolactobacillus shoreicorticis TaxID=1923877 RepID=A0ABW5S2Z7_9BACL|nr:SIS domain-containing protein [Sporolactobacillus shoreicorticis]MCO7124231.1 SIS domain-containing protein [Sporolactobacillus shoreicorticis]
MNNIMNTYFEHVKQIAETVLETQEENMRAAANFFAETIKSGHTIYAFGASHAGIITEELFYRTGGLALINPVLTPSLMLNTKPVTMTSKMERLSGFGKIIFSTLPASEGDTLLIHSVSGRNPVSIEMAIAAQEKGLNTVALTNLTYSKQVTSRHSSGKRLFEVCDLVIDNCGDFEDSSMQLAGLEQKVAPTSTAIGSLIANAIVLKTAEKLLDEGITPPVFHSSNVDGGDAFNTKIFKAYTEQIHYM